MTASPASSSSLSTVQLIDGELLALGAILVEQRVLRRIVRGHRDVHGFGRQVPHEQCYVLPRTELVRFLERGDVAVDTAQLPESVIVVSGDRAQLAGEAPEAQTALWRTIFHARIHQKFDELKARDAFGTSVIRERTHRIGQTEFDAIRWVLRQENLLLPPVDMEATYVEFVALYVELRFFDPDAVERTFPAAGHFDTVIELDLDVDALLAASRPPRAPAEPFIKPPAPEPTTTAPIEYVVPAARKRAVAARGKGNVARAAILAARSGDLVEARHDLDELVEWLSRAFGNADTTGWAEGLLPLVQFAASQRSQRNPGARLLHDLQSACIIADREVKVADVVGWALSRGKRALVRPLPATRVIRAARRVRSAVAKLAACAFATAEQQESVSSALHDIAGRADDHVRASYRPAIVAALHEVGLEPHTLPERVAEKTLVDELLDRAVAVGVLSLGDLRDALSRNDLKLPDLRLSELASGDPLLRADEKLAVSLDGVYRRGESYMRALQKVSSLLFGTMVGRVLTLYLLLPFLGSFAVLEGVQQMSGKIVARFGYDLHADSREMLIGGAAFLFLVLHVRLLRRGLAYALRWTWRVLRLVLFDIPIGLWRHRITRWFLASPLVRWGVRPAIPAAITVLITWNLGWRRWPIGGGVFVFATLLLNTRWIRLAEEIAGDWALRSGRYLGRIVPGLIKLTLEVFAKLLELVERGLYRVDEWLRFRVGQPRIMLVLKGAFGIVWFFITYVVRLYVNLFVEPTVNPIKHFPVVTVAAKIILPFIPRMVSGIAAVATPLMGPELGNGFAAFTILVLPGLAGFLVWEFKENWRIYKATRAQTLQPIVVGHHGETMARLLRPGFHSGTIPKLFTKLRRAAWKHDEHGVARAKEGLHHVEEAVILFVDRQLASILDEAEAFRAMDVAVSRIEIGSNRVHIELASPSVSPEPAIIRIELEAGWLLAGIAQLGWIATLDDEQKRIVEIALAGFYKLAAVDVVREQIEHVLRSDATGVPRYGITEEGLIVWPGRSFETEVLYDLNAKRPKPRLRGAAYEGEPAILAGKHAVFSKVPLYWSMWSTAWLQVSRGIKPMRVSVGPPLLPHNTLPESDVTSNRDP